MLLGKKLFTFFLKDHNRSHFKTSFFTFDFTDQRLIFTFLK